MSYLLLLLIPLLLIGGLYMIRKTPYGLLDTKVAIALKVVPERKKGLSVEVQREQMNKMMASYNKGNPILKVDNQQISIDGFNIPIRIYSNHAETNLPVLLFFHGGGWVVGNIDTHDGICRQLAKVAKVVIISVDYRLAPEHPYPIPLLDCYAALEWVHKNAKTIGGNPDKIAVSGDSAGGNLAAAVCLKSKAENGPKISYQALIYPVTDLSKLTTISYQNFATNFFLTRDMMAQYINHYVTDEPTKLDAYASPLLAQDLTNLPPTLVITAGFDPLRDEGEAYGERLKAAGVPVSITRYKGTIHGFFGLGALGEAGIIAVKEVGDKLTEVFYG